MKPSALILASIAFAALLLTACGQSPQTGSEAEAVGGPVVDPGILKDPTTYRPTEPPGGDTPITRRTVAGGGSTRTGGSAADAGETGAEIGLVVQDLVGLITDGEAALALRLFNPEHVGELPETSVDTLFITFEAIDRLGRSLEEKLEPEQVSALMRELRGIGAEDPEIDVLDASHATVKPNVARIMFGTVGSSRSLALAKQDGVWRFQLEQPLTADDAGDIAIYHSSLQVTLDRITQWIDSTSQVGEEQLRDVFSLALDGEQIDLEEYVGEIRDSGTETRDQPRGGRVAPRSGGGRVAPGGGGRRRP
jgi:hypothetical protein